jgi:hypothetical protein
MDEARETYEEALKVDEVKTQRLIWICYADFETN